MRGCTSCFGCLVYIFITFWVLLFSIIFISSAQWLFDRNFYAETFTNDALIDAIYDDALPRLYNDNVFFRQVDEGDLSNQAFGDALREIAPKEYIVKEINNIIDAIGSYIQGETNRLDYRLNTQIIRDNLTNPTQASAFAEVLVERLPACEGGQSYYGKSSLPACLPSGVTAEQITEQVTNNLANFAISMPNEIQLFHAPRRSADTPTFNVGDVSQATTQGIMVFAGIILFITALMGADGLRSFLRRMSIMLLIPAGLLLWGSGFMTEAQNQPDFLSGLQITINNKVIDEGPLVDATQEVIGNSLDRVTSDVSKTSTVALAIAGVLFFLSLLPTPGSGRGLDSTLQLPPSGKVGRMTSKHNSPIQGI